MKEQNALKRKTVLVIEDDEAILNAVSRLLHSQQLRVISAGNSQVGMKLAFEYLPDLVVCCHCMQEESSLELLRRIRNDERTANTPFVLLTRGSGFKTDTRWRRLGVSAFVQESDDVFKLFWIVPELIRREELRSS